jgi:outer membrane protein assembly factor BamB
MSLALFWYNTPRKGGFVVAYRDTEEATILLVGLNGVVIGLDKKSGEILWKNELKGGGIGRVVLEFAQGRIFASAEGDKLFCIDYHTGSTLWEAKTTHSGGEALGTTILVHEECIFVSKWGYIDCFSWDGTKLWAQELKGLGVGRAMLKIPV